MADIQPCQMGVAAEFTSVDINFGMNSVMPNWLLRSQRPDDIYYTVQNLFNINPLLDANTILYKQ